MQVRCVGQVVGQEGVPVAAAAAAVVGKDGSTVMEAMRSSVR